MRHSGVCLLSPPLLSCSQTSSLSSRDPRGNYPGRALGSDAQPSQFTHCKERYLARDASFLICEPKWLCSVSAQSRRAWHICLVIKNKKNQPLPLAMSSSSSWSNPCRWHFLQSPMLVELYCLLHSSTALIAKICLLFLAKRSFPSQRSNLDLLALRGRLLLEL